MLSITTDIEAESLYHMNGYISYYNNITYIVYGDCATIGKLSITAESHISEMNLSAKRLGKYDLVCYKRSMQFVLPYHASIHEINNNNNTHNHASNVKTIMHSHSPL